MNFTCNVKWVSECPTGFYYSQQELPFLDKAKDADDAEKWTAAERGKRRQKLENLFWSLSREEGGMNLTHHQPRLPSREAIGSKEPSATQAIRHIDRSI